MGSLNTKSKWHKQGIITLGCAALLASAGMLMPIQAADQDETETMGYVYGLSYTAIDGTAPFDDKDMDGYDSASDNGIVRSFDSITYDLTATFAPRDELATAKSCDLHFYAEFDGDITEARWDMDTMLWLKDTWEIQCLDADGNVVLYQATDGNYYTSKDSNGNYISKTTINAIATGSDDVNPYSTSIVKQVLTGSYTLESEDNVYNGDKTLVSAIAVKNGKNGQTIAPTFKVWLGDNKENYTNITDSDTRNSNRVATEPITISAGAYFDTNISKNVHFSLKGWYDFANGAGVTDASTTQYTIGDATVTGAQLYDLLECLGTLAENSDISEPERFTDTEGMATDYLNGLTLSDYASVFSQIRYGSMKGYGISVSLESDNTTGKQKKRLFASYG